jgi:hypothetical protein
MPVLRPTIPTHKHIIIHCKVLNNTPSCHVCVISWSQALSLSSSQFQSKLNLLKICNIHMFSYLISNIRNNYISNTIQFYLL